MLTIHLEQKDNRTTIIVTTFIFNVDESYFAQIRLECLRFVFLHNLCILGKPYSTTYAPIFHSFRMKDNNNWTFLFDLDLWFSQIEMLKIHFIQIHVIFCAFQGIYLIFLSHAMFLKRFAQLRHINAVTLYW